MLLVISHVIYFSIALSLLSTGYTESEAAAMKTLLLEQNITSDNIILEEEADSTVQNAIKSNYWLFDYKLHRLCLIQSLQLYIVLNV